MKIIQIVAGRGECDDLFALDSDGVVYSLYAGSYRLTALPDSVVPAEFKAENHDLMVNVHGWVPIAHSTPCTITLNGTIMTGRGGGATALQPADAEQKRQFAEELKLRSGGAPAPRETVDEPDKTMFFKWTAEAVDSLDATFFTGDEFVGPERSERRAHMRAFCERWLRLLDEEDRA